MDERLQFVARRLASEAMAELCREFGISKIIVSCKCAFFLFTVELRRLHQARNSVLVNSFMIPEQAQGAPDALSRRSCQNAL
jgi:hypothetical protein